MDITGKTRIRHKQPASTDRFLGAFSHAPSDNAGGASTSAGAGDELNEDDIFWTGDFSADSNHSQSHSNSSSPSSRVISHNRLLHPKGFAAQPEGFGILAALPENEASSPNLRDHSHFYLKASNSSSSSSSSSSARLISVIPKPPQERIMPAPSSSVKYHQSAPVNVPMMSMAMSKPRDFFALDADVDDNGDGDAEMLPPHEIVARSSAQSPMLAYSVLEGVGRTLKGRDLRQVRNAVWRQTGFLD
ncbi:Senescence regulator [Parasponia andersonii]|uniref:Senescence regulator n=1 Tax=Parasponia andersonii TaxID=3476 RepID=A0A2P5CWJ4_PARAD|nr:Senescence regulator [Parasponia andersonii]